MSAVIALAAAIATGSLPFVSATLSPFITVISMIPPLAVLPILFIVFGLDELSKVVLIVIGITPMIIRDLHSRAREIPAELWVKAQTLGATSWTLILRVVAAAIAAASAGGDAAVARLGVAVSDRSGSDRFDGWPRLPHLPGAPLSRDGRDPALRGVDHAARVAHRRAAAPR